MFLCYLIANGESRTYIGYTNDFKKRIRQHNGELSGGAKYTTAHKGTTGWEPVALITGIEDKSTCLSLEWRMKKRRNSKGKLKPSSGIDARLKNIFEIIEEDKISNKSPAPSEIPLISIIINKKFEGKLEKLVDLNEFFINNSVSNLSLEFKENSEIITIENSEY